VEDCLQATVVGAQRIGDREDLDKVRDDEEEAEAQKSGLIAKHCTRMPTGATARAFVGLSECNAAINIL
jgi:hypothetical protein